MDLTTKSVDAAVKPVESDNPNGEFEVILSTEALDRDGEHLWIDEWKQPLPSRIHIDGDHGMSIEKTVGSVVPRIEGNKLVGKGTYAPTPYAQMVRQIVNDKDAEGHGICMSVTFAEKKNRKDGKPERELLNAAFVAVPANPEALVLSSKAKKKPDDKPYGDVTYADPGYQDDGKERYPIDTAEHVRAALSYIDQHRDDDKYTPGQLAKIRDKIRAAASKFGIDIGSDDKKTVDDAVTKDADDGSAGMSTSGNNPVPQKLPQNDLTQAIHDAAVHLGAQCVDEVYAESNPPADTGKSVDPEMSDSKSVAKSPEASDESAAAEPAEKSAGSTAADESAADRAKQYLVMKSRVLQFQIPTE